VKTRTISRQFNGQRGTSEKGEIKSWVEGRKKDSTKRTERNQHFFANAILEKTERKRGSSRGNGKGMVTPLKSKGGKEFENIWVGGEG